MMCEDSNSSRRMANFSDSERRLLIQIISNKYASILEDKKTDKASVFQKDQAWKKIEQDFNSTSSTNVYRNAISLKKCYGNRKKILRKTLANEKKEVMLTGGGLPPKRKRDDCDELLMAFINKKTLTGLENPFDDDSDNCLIDISNNSTTEVILEQEDETVNASLPVSTYNCFFKCPF